MFDFDLTNELKIILAKLAKKDKKKFDLRHTPHTEEGKALV